MEFKRLGQFLDDWGSTSLFYCNVFCFSDLQFSQSSSLALFDVKFYPFDDIPIFVEILSFEVYFPVQIAKRDLSPHLYWILFLPFHLKF